MACNNLKQAFQRFERRFFMYRCDIFNLEWWIIISTVQEQKFRQCCGAVCQNTRMVRWWRCSIWVGYGERAGSGVPDIYATWDNAGYAAPTVEGQFGSGQPNRTIVTLPMVEKVPVVSCPQPEKQPEKKSGNWNKVWTDPFFDCWKAINFTERNQT